MLLICFAILALASVVGTLESVDLQQYHQLPKLNVFDNYAECKNEFPDYIYCAVDVVVKPDVESVVWQKIQEVNGQWKENYRHDRLQRGFCLNRCQERVRQMNSTLQALYYQDPLSDNSQKFGPNLFANSSYFRSKYDRLINVCVNQELVERHGLKGHSIIEYCVTRDSVVSIPDRWDKKIYQAFGILIIVIIVATLKDYNSLCKDEKKGVVQAFSLLVNWRQLTTSRKVNPTDDIKFIDSIRFLLTNQLVLMHAGFLIVSLPSLNPEYLELKFETLEVRMSINSHLIVQTFFFISGFLQVRNFLLEKNQTFGFRYFWKTIFKRYIRLSSVVIAVICIDSTILFKLSEGPFWPRIADPLRYFCRKNWWKTLLCVNNYVGSDELCVQHSWYLAANFQLYILGLVLLGVVLKFPERKLQILIPTIFVSYLLPGVVTYLGNFDGVAIFDLESFKYCFWYSRDYKEAYIPTHMNMGNYFIGFAFGYFMDWIKATNFDISKSKLFKVLWYTVLPLQILTISSGYVFYIKDYEKPSVIAAVYAVVHKIVWGLLNVVFFWGLMSNMGSFIKSFLNNKVVSTLGKLSYSVYLIHMTCARVIMGYNMQPVYMHEKGMDQINIPLFLYSYVTALGLCLCIEYPVINLQRMFSKKIKSA